MVAVAVVVALEAVHIEHQQREEVLGAERTIRLRFETAVEVPAVEEPGERIGLRETLERLALLLLNEHRADVPGDELEHLEVGLIEGTPVLAIGHAQHAAGLVVDDDRNAHERIGAVGPFARLDRRGRRVAHQERALRGGHKAGDAFTCADADVALHVIREPHGARDHEVRRVVLAKKQRRSFAAHQLGGDLEDGVEQILCPALALVVHVPPLLRCRNAALHAATPQRSLARFRPCGSLPPTLIHDKRRQVSKAGQ